METEVDICTQIKCDFIRSVLKSEDLLDIYQRPEKSLCLRMFDKLMLPSVILQRSSLASKDNVRTTDILPSSSELYPEHWKHISESPSVETKSHIPIGAPKTVKLASSLPQRRESWNEQGTERVLREDEMCEDQRCPSFVKRGVTDIVSETVQNHIECGHPISDNNSGTKISRVEDHSGGETALTYDVVSNQSERDNHTAPGMTRQIHLTANPSNDLELTLNSGLPQEHTQRAPATPSCVSENKDTPGMSNTTNIRDNYENTAIDTNKAINGHICPIPNFSLLCPRERSNRKTVHGKGVKKLKNHATSKRSSWLSIKNLKHSLLHKARKKHKTFLAKSTSNKPNYELGKRHIVRERVETKQQNNFIVHSISENGIKLHISRSSENSKTENLNVKDALAVKSKTLPDELLQTSQNDSTAMEQTIQYLSTRTGNSNMPFEASESIYESSIEDSTQETTVTVIPDDKASISVTTAIVIRDNHFIADSVNTHSDPQSRDKRTSKCDDAVMSVQGETYQLHQLHLDEKKARVSNKKAVSPDIPAESIRRNLQYEKWGESSQHLCTKQGNVMAEDSVGQNNDLISPSQTTEDTGKDSHHGKWRNSSENESGKQYTTDCIAIEKAAIPLTQTKECIDIQHGQCTQTQVVEYNDKVDSSAQERDLMSELTGNDKESIEHGRRSTQQQTQVDASQQLTTLGMENYPLQLMSDFVRDHNDQMYPNNTKKSFNHNDGEKQLSLSFGSGYEPKAVEQSKVENIYACPTGHNRDTIAKSKHKRWKPKLTSRRNANDPNFQMIGPSSHFRTVVLDGKVLNIPCSPNEMDRSKEYHVPRNERAVKTKPYNWLPAYGTTANVSNTVSQIVPNGILPDYPRSVCSFDLDTLRPFMTANNNLVRRRILNSTDRSNIQTSNTISKMTTSNTISKMATASGCKLPWNFKTSKKSKEVLYPNVQFPFLPGYFPSPQFNNQMTVLDSSRPEHVTKSRRVANYKKPHSMPMTVSIASKPNLSLQEKANMTSDLLLTSAPFSPTRKKNINHLNHGQFKEQFSNDPNEFMPFRANGGYNAKSGYPVQTISGNDHRTHLEQHQYKKDMNARYFQSPWPNNIHGVFNPKTWPATKVGAPNYVHRPKHLTAEAIGKHAGSSAKVLFRTNQLEMTRLCDTDVQIGGSISVHNSQIKSSANGPSNLMVEATTESCHPLVASASGDHSSLSSCNVNVKASNEMQRMPCVVCGKEVNFICTGCKKALYCSPRCQLLTWWFHKDKCGLP